MQLHLNTNCLFKSAATRLLYSPAMSGCRPENASTAAAGARRRERRTMRLQFVVRMKQEWWLPAWRCECGRPVQPAYRAWRVKRAGGHTPRRWEEIEKTVELFTDSVSMLTVHVLSFGSPKAAHVGG